ncbi:MAG: hypothetical protein RLZZ528_1100 [Pseudomonadota bacterium]|jgi:cysteine desulfurase
MTGRLYLDWNATAPLRPEARAAMASAMNVTGNASSVHAEGRAARALVERARAQVAAAVGCKPAEVVFTSGATEAASVLARMPGGMRVDPTAHDCLWAHRREGAGEGADALAWGYANNETGVIADVPAHDGPRLVDIVQAVGKVPLSFAWMGVEMAIVSAHKFGGPKGVGALIVRDGVEVPALSQGGGQEMGRRAGTENITGIAGMGAAAEAAARDLADGLWDGVAEVRNILESALEAGTNGSIVVGGNETRLPNTTCLVTPGWKGETQVMQMDLAGFAVSAGSACSSGKVRPSRVLTAMGFDDDAAASAIRVSIGPGVGREDVLRFADAWLAAARRHRARAA